MNRAGLRRPGSTLAALPAFTTEEAPMREADVEQEEPRPGSIKHAAEVSRLLDLAERWGVRISAAKALREPLHVTRAEIARLSSARRRA